jgi:hypothetical protein
MSSVEPVYTVTGSRYVSKITPLEIAYRNFENALKNSDNMKNVLDKHPHVTRGMTSTANNEFYMNKPKLDEYNLDKYNYKISLEQLSASAIKLSSIAIAENHKDFENIAAKAIESTTVTLHRLASGRKTRRRIIDRKKPIHRKERKTKIRRPYKNITKGRGPEETAYQEALDKIKDIFGKTILENALKYGKSEYIQELINLIKAEKSKYDTNISNQEQITKILHPALENLLTHIKDNYIIRVFGVKTHPLQLFIPSVVDVTTVLNPKRIKNILELAEKNNFVEDQLIEEFIKNLEVLKLGMLKIEMLKSGVVSSITMSERPPASLVASLPAPISLPAPVSLPAPLPTAPPQLPSPSSYKAQRTSKSPHKSKSPYKSNRSKSPEPVVAIRVSQKTQSNPNAIIVDGKDVKIIHRLAKGKNNKKTRRHK